MTVHKSAVLLFAGLMCFCQVSSRSQERGKMRTLDIETCPLKIKLTPSQRNLDVGNYSDKLVKGYKLGCVVIEADKVAVKCTFDVRKVELKPSDPKTDSIYFESFGVSKTGLWHCEDMSAMLAVVEVYFSDGTVWRIAQLSELR